MRKIKSSYNANYDFQVTTVTDEETSKITAVTVGLTAEQLATLGDQVTVVVVPVDTTTVADDNIYYINQDANANAATMLTAMGTTDLYVDANADEVQDETDYEVWIGGTNGTILKGAFTTTVASEEIDYGNVDITGASAEVIDNKDAIAVLEASAGLITFSEDVEKVANVDQTGASAEVIDNKDAIAVLEASAGLIDASAFPYKD